VYLTLSNLICFLPQGTDDSSGEVMVSDENLPNVNKTKHPKKRGEKGKWSITIYVGCAYDLHSCSNSSLSCGLNS
jgi:hypothetical protein